MTLFKLQYVDQDNSVELIWRFHSAPIPVTILHNLQPFIQLPFLCPSSSDHSVTMVGFNHGMVISLTRCFSTFRIICPISQVRQLPIMAHLINQALCKIHVHGITHAVDVYAEDSRGQQSIESFCQYATAPKAINFVKQISL